jgi:CHAD domain-containing protein
MLTGMAKAAKIVGLDASTPAEVAGRRILEIRFGELLALCEAARREPSVDAVHDARVASRRMRAAMSLFAYGDAFAGERAELQRLGKSLGVVRDLDVHIGWLEGELARMPAEAIVRLLSDQKRSRARALPKLADELGRYLVEEAPGWSRHIPQLELSGRLGGKRMAKRLRRRLRAAQKRAEALGGPSSTTVRARPAHRLRIAVKKLRYTSELLAGALPETAEPLLASLTALQETLGDLHDRDTRIELVERALDREGGHARPALLHLLDATVDERERLAMQLRASLDDPSLLRSWKTLRRRLK